MNYDAERAMSQKRLRMDGEGGHGVVQGNGLPLNYMDNGHQIAYGAYPGAYNTHYPPPEAFSAYGPPPPGGYAPQNLSYAPPAHQNYPPHHQSFPPQQPQQLHMGQPHMGYGVEHGSHPVHKPGWPQHILAGAHDQHKPLEMKPKPEVKLEPTDAQKRPLSQERDPGEIDQPKIKIKTDIFKPEDVQLHPQQLQAQQQQQQSLQPVPPAQPPLQPPPSEQPPQEIAPSSSAQEISQSAELPNKDETLVEQKSEDKTTEALATDVTKTEGQTTQSETPKVEGASQEGSTTVEEDKKPGLPIATSPAKTPVTPAGLEPKKRGRPKGSTNRPRGVMPPGPRPQGPGRPATTIPTSPRAAMGRPRGSSFYNAVRPFRKDFSGIQFRRRWSDDGLDSSNIPNEVYFGDVPVSMEVLFNYYDASAEKEKLQALKQQQAKLVAAKLQARGIIQQSSEKKVFQQVTTVDSSSEETSSGSEESDSSDSEEDAPLKQRKSSTSSAGNATPGRRGRPPVPPELRGPGILDMKKFCKAAGIRFDYKKLTEGCTKNKERIDKMMELLVKAGLEGKATLEKCQALKEAKQKKISEEKQKKKGKPVKAKTKESGGGSEVPPVERRMTRGATGTKPRQKIVISSDEEDDSPDARITISKLRQMVKDK